MSKKLIILTSVVLALGLVSSALGAEYLWTNDYEWSYLWISPWNWDPISPYGGPGAYDTALLEGGPAQGPLLETDIQVGCIRGPQYLGPDLRPDGMTMWLIKDCDLVVDDWDAYDAGDSNGTVKMADNAKADINAEARWTDHGTHIVDMSDNASATFHSTWQTGDGNDAWFELHMTDNTSLSVSGALRIGDDGGGIYDFSGSATVHAGSWLIRARDAAAVGTMNASESASVYVEQTTGVQLDGGAGTVTMNVSDVAEVNTCTLVVGGGGSGTLNITDMATVIVRCCLRLPDNDEGISAINLLGGILDTASIEHAGDDWTIDICANGVMVVEADVRADLQADVAAGHVTAYGGRGIVVVDFNNVNPGKTTIWARPVHYVDGDANGTGDGTSWENAFNYLQDALLDANSNPDIEIWVAAGVYKPDANSTHPEGTRDRAATFQLINGVVLRGGYAGCDANDPNVRDFELFKTILSADLNNDDGPDFANNGENSLHVVTGSGTDQTAILDGFTITAGDANGGNYPDDHGAGVFNASGSPTIINCILIANAAHESHGSGAGMFNGDNSDPAVINCIFTGNKCGYGGAGMANDQGSSPELTNCLFSGNRAGNHGGGLANWYLCDPNLTNCTFTQNEAGNSGGGINNDDRCRPTLSSCIVWGNSAPTCPEICDLRDSLTTANYSDIEGGWLGNGNIDANPLFVDPNNADYHLLPDSQCMDAGDNNSVPADTPDLDGDGNTTEAIPIDLAGNPRFVDQPDVPDTGNGTAPIVDMGAYEANYIEVAMRFTPQALNLDSKGKWVKAHFALPEGCSPNDVDTNTPAVVTSFGIESDHMNVFINEDGLVEIEAAFSRSDFCGSATSNDATEVMVIGLLTSGQQFYGTDTIRITANYLKYLATIASHWLEAGCDKPDWCSGLDLDQDSGVDFIDYTLFDGCCIEVVDD